MSSEMSSEMSSSLDLLDLRLKHIEDRVLGRRLNTNDIIKDNSNNILQQLTQIESKLKALTTGKERFNNCFKKCQQMDKYLDNEYIDRIVATDSSKFEQILSFEEQIRSEAKDLEVMSEMSKNIDSSHIRDNEDIETKINKIRFVCIKQSQETDQIEDKSKQLVLYYNQWLQTIKTQLKDWDQMLTQLENKEKTKKTKVDID